MITHSLRRNVSCDGCGYVIEGLYPDLSNRKDHELTVLDRWGETFHFHGGKSDCFRHFQGNKHVRVRAMLDREYVRTLEAYEVDARQEYKDDEVTHRKRYEELVADEQPAAA